MRVNIKKFDMCLNIEKQRQIYKARAYRAFSIFLYKYIFQIFTFGRAIRLFHFKKLAVRAYEKFACI
jgi:hypothetical protein